MIISSKLTNHLFCNPINNNNQYKYNRNNFKLNQNKKSKINNNNNNNNNNNQIHSNYKHLFNNLYCSPIDLNHPLVEESKEKEKTL